MPVVGVSGILRKEQETWESTDRSLQEAFQDLNALMRRFAPSPSPVRPFAFAFAIAIKKRFAFAPSPSPLRLLKSPCSQNREATKKRDRSSSRRSSAMVSSSKIQGKAKEMVILAEKMRLKLLSGSKVQENSVDEEMGSWQEMQDWLLSIGIISPVTKESAGAQYHQQLSRQLADFVKLPLEKAGGMIALIDIYCLFNRARGTELISPEDLIQACALWEKIDVPVMLRKFDSGVMTIQNKAHSDEEVFAKVTSLAGKPDALHAGISPSDAALTLGIAPALAKEHLLTAEAKGLLCRDVSPDGFRFYANLFEEFDTKNIYWVKKHGLFQAWISATSASG